MLHSISEDFVFTIFLAGLDFYLIQAYNSSHISIFSGLIWASLMQWENTFAMIFTFAPKPVFIWNMSQIGLRWECKCSEKYSLHDLIWLEHWPRTSFNVTAHSLTKTLSVGKLWARIDEGRVYDPEKSF